MNYFDDPGWVRCSSEYVLCPAHYRRCIEGHIEGRKASQTHGPLHMNRAGFAWSDQDAEAARREQVTELKDCIAAVLAYVDQLPCPNCDHVHNDGRKCTVVREFTGPCRCDWGPTDITKDIRNLLKAES